MAGAGAAAAGATAPMVALNPLPWILGPQGVEPLDRRRLPAVLADVREAGFTAVMADVPADMAVPDYLEALDDAGLRPAPGYLAAPFHDGSALPEVLEAVRRTGRQHAELGLTEVFVAGDMLAHRTERPATGEAPDPGALATFSEQLERAAEVLAAEGVRACLHPHVGTLVEVEDEVRFVLDHTDAGLVGFGPDTGHLLWAGMDPAAIIGDYADRVAAVHLKDVHAAVATRAREQRLDYATATFGEHLWTEPGRGDVDLTAVLRALTGHTGWWLVEVDVPDRMTAQQSAALSAAWVRENLTAHDNRGVPL